MIIVTLYRASFKRRAAPIAVSPTSSGYPVESLSIREPGSAVYEFAIDSVIWGERSGRFIVEAFQDGLVVVRVAGDVLREVTLRPNRKPRP